MIFELNRLFTQKKKLSRINLDHFPGGHVDHDNLTEGVLMFYNGRNERLFASFRKYDFKNM